MDDPGCASGGGVSCPIYDVIDGNVAVSFTDDPEDPATQAGIESGGREVRVHPDRDVGDRDRIQRSRQREHHQFPARLVPAHARPGGRHHDATLDGAGRNWRQCRGRSLCGARQKGAMHGDDAEESGDHRRVHDARREDGQPRRVTVQLADPQGRELRPVFVCRQYAANKYSGRPIGSSPKVWDGSTGYTLLNPWPFTYDNTGVSEDGLAAMWPSTSSGATFETTGWMCNAPNADYTVSLPWSGGGQATVQDILSGQQVLADAEFDPVAAPGNTNGLLPGIVDQRIVSPADDCQTLSALPIDFGPISGEQYQPSSSPITAAHAVTGAVLKMNGTGGGFAFTAMDSSEADFFGLLPRVCRTRRVRSSAPVSNRSPTP